MTKDEYVENVFFQLMPHVTDLELLKQIITEDIEVESEFLTEREKQRLYQEWVEAYPIAYCQLLEVLC